MQLEELIEQCGEITKAKGFDVTQIRTQIALFISEIVESLEFVTSSENSDTDNFIYDVAVRVIDYEDYRAKTFDHKDKSCITNKEAFLEELADLQIRMASFIHGNGLTDDFVQALVSKIEKNKQRPMRHGKGF